MLLTKGISLQFATAFHRSDRTDVGVSNREIAVLSVIESHRETGICAADVIDVLDKINGKETRLSTVYDVILSLEKKGLIVSCGTSAPDIRGRSRNLFTSTRIGQNAIKLSEEMCAA